jgi:hypothetical protein
MLRSCLIWMGLAAGLAGAALGLDYHLKPVPAQPLESYPSRVTVGQVTVAVDPYATDEKSFTVFDVKDLNSRGFFPLLILVQNASPNPIALRTREIVLVGAEGPPLYSHPATLVVQDIFKGGILTKIPKVGAKDPGTSMRTGSPLLDFTGKELTNRGIDPGNAASGFLFFYSSAPKKNPFAGARLRIPKILDESTRKDLGPFEIPIGTESPAR